MADSFSKDYNEIVVLEKQIQNDLKYRKAMDNKDPETFKLEEKIRKAIENLRKQQSILNTTYTAKYSSKKVDLPEKEINRRINSIRDLEQSCNNMKSTYDSILDNKYRYQGDPNKLNFSNYKEIEDHKNLTNSELLSLQKKKIEG